jgi:hypothetical protein
VAPPRSRVRLLVGANFGPMLKNLSRCDSPALVWVLSVVSDGRSGFGGFLTETFGSVTSLAIVSCVHLEC